MAMVLTPIRVRGRRWAPGTRNRGSSRHPRRVRAEEQRPRPREPKQEASKKQPSLSSLERLPTEILERIAEESLNLSLPLTSRGLFLRLRDSDHLKRAHVIAAFGPTWAAWFGVERRNVQSYHGWQADVRRVEGDPARQSVVLSLPWAKLPDILKFYQYWIRHNAWDREYSNLELPPIDSRLTGVLSYYPRVQQMFTELEEGPMTSRLLLDFTDFIFQSGATRTSEDFDAASYCQALSRSAWVSRYVEVHPQTRIPDALLKGPWDDEMLIRLFWLVRGGASLNGSRDWELTLEGFQNLMACENLMLMYPILFIFCALEVFSEQWPMHLLDEVSCKVHGMVLHNTERLNDRDFAKFSVLTTDVLRRAYYRRLHPDSVDHDD